MHKITHFTGIYVPLCAVDSDWFLSLSACLINEYAMMENVSGYVCNHGSLRVGNETLRPLGVAMGGTSSAWPVSEAYIQKHHLLAGDSLWRHYRRDHSIKGRRENTSSTSSSEACVQSMAPRLEDAVSRSLLSGNHGYT